VDLEIRCPIAVYITPENMTGVSEFSCREGDVSLFLYHFLCWDEISARGGRIGRSARYFPANVEFVQKRISKDFLQGFTNCGVRPVLAANPFDPHPARPFCASLNAVLSRPSSDSLRRGALKLASLVVVIRRTRFGKLK
jgi:hypothetical protein